MDTDMDENTISSMILWVILDDSDTLRVSDDIKRWNDRKYHHNKIFINVTGQFFSFPTDVTDFVHENSVIYIPKWMHSLFTGVTDVKITLIDPHTIKDIASIVVKPLTPEFHKRYTKDILDKFLLSANFISKNIPISTKEIGFEINDLISTDGNSIAYGMITRNTRVVVFSVAISETPIQQRFQTSTVADFSPVKTSVYKRMYIRNGEIVFIK